MLRTKIYIVQHTICISNATGVFHAESSCILYVRPVVTFRFQFSPTKRTAANVTDMKAAKLTFL